MSAQSPVHQAHAANLRLMNTAYRRSVRRLFLVTAAGLTTAGREKEYVERR
jgi:hypothetical protein